LGLASKIRKWRLLSPQFKRILIKATFLSLMNEFFLKLHIYKPLKEMHQKQENTEASEINPETLKQLQHISKAMKIIEKFAPWRPKCYNRALTAKKLLSDKNITTDLHIGFRKKDGEFDGHAWITYKGKIVTGKINGLHLFNELKPLST